MTPLGVVLHPGVAIGIGVGIAATIQAVEIVKARSGSQNLLGLLL